MRHPTPLPEPGDIQQRAEDRVGTTLDDRWELAALLGIGGMAAVYEARDTHRDRRVALKVLHPEVATDDLIRKRFRREARAADLIAHPGVVPVEDVYERPQGLFLVMALLEGETLDALQERKGRLPPARVVAIADAILAVLEAAHAVGVLHRDLKPDNVFITDHGDIKVLDFGIARIREGDGRGTTQTGDVMGTPLFMAPEQARGRPDDVDARSDLFSLGAVMFTLLTGRPIHVAETATDALVKVVTQPVTPLRDVAPAVPSALAQVVDRALAFDASDRFEGATAMRRALAEVRVDPEAVPLSPGRSASPPLSDDAPPGSLPMTPRRWPWVAFGVGTLAAGLGGWGWREMDPDPAEAPTPPPVALPSAASVVA
ncbi:MAG: serine/threonine-protein kinase, partial [Myxococcota bacterium]